MNRAHGRFCYFIASIVISFFKVLALQYQHPNNMKLFQIDNVLGVTFGVFKEISPNTYKY